MAAFRRACPAPVDALQPQLLHLEARLGTTIDSTGSGAELYDEDGPHRGCAHEGSTPHGQQAHDCAGTNANHYSPSHNAHSPRRQPREEQRFSGP